jgi:photoactive yellow protein
MSNTLPLQFNESNIDTRIGSLSEAEIDQLDFGVIGFDEGTEVCVYNTFEAKSAGLSPERVLGQALFNTVAPCMNNFMVAQRFEDAAAEAQALDVTLDYVLTLRMRPVKVRLRLVATPGQKLRYVLVERR